MNQLAEVLLLVEQEYIEVINPKATQYTTVDLEATLWHLGMPELAGKYPQSEVAVPRRDSPAGMNIFIGADAFLADFQCQLESGLVVSRQIAEDSGLSYTEYRPSALRMCSTLVGEEKQDY